MYPRIGGMCVLSLLLISAVVAAADRDAAAEVVSNDSGLEVAGLKDQLSAGLRARLPSEFTFIAIVVDKVEANELPLDLVMSTFQWARRKRPYPFPYFEHALRVRAENKGIQL
jgi:hypothetical protein